jgi:hypothetical protein
VNRGHNQIDQKSTMAATMSFRDALSPQDIALFDSSMTNYTCDASIQTRIWHANQLPKRGNVGNDHVIGLLGMGFANPAHLEGKVKDFRHDHALLRQWALARIRLLYIGLAQRNDLLLDGQRCESWNAVRYALGALLVVGDEKSMRKAKEIQIGFWERVPWKLVLEEEYMRTRRIRYRPLHVMESGMIRVNCIAKVIGVKYNDIGKEIKMVTDKVAHCHIISKKRGQGQLKDVTADLANNQVDVPPPPPRIFTSYLVSTVGAVPKDHRSFKCTGDCSFSKDLREELAVVHQSLADTVNEYDAKLEVSPIVPI